jgi:hypothetical protein
MTPPEPVPSSENIPPRSRSPMQLVAERQTADPPPTRPMSSWPSSTPPTTPPPEYTEQAWARPDPANRAWKAGVLGAINVLAMVLAGRGLVLVAIAGAIFLTYLTLGNPDVYRLSALGIYCVAVVIPCVALACFGR